MTCDDAFIDTNMKPNSSILIVVARQTELAQKALAIEKKHLNYPGRRDVKTLIQIVAQLSFRLPRYRPVLADRMGNMPMLQHIPMTPVPGRAGRLGLVCALAVSVLWPCIGTTGELAWGAVATPLRIVNLNPFQFLYGVPGSLGARVMAPGSSEVIASMDLASHLVEASSGAERVLIDGETHRQGLALRHGFGEGWEYLFEVSALSHRAGRLDGFIETWHDVFHLPQGDRDRTPRDRLALVYANGGRTYYDIGESVSSLGDISLGLGYAVPHWPLQNDGLAIRGSVKLPTGDESALTGSGGYSASLWAETSGALPGSTDSRSWLYSASLGALAGEAPSGLSDIGGRFVAFGHLGVTWRPLNHLSLTVQLDAHSSPYGTSDVAPLADPGVMLGLGGALRLSEQATLEIAVTEDDGLHRGAPDIGLHTAIRWRP